MDADCCRQGLAGRRKHFAEEVGRISGEEAILGGTGTFSRTAVYWALTICSTGIVALNPHTNHDLDHVFIIILQMRK